MRSLSIVMAALALYACSNDSTPSATTTDGTDSGSLVKKDAGTAPMDDAAPPPACDPPAQAGELFALSAENLDGTRVVSMCEFRGKVLLIVNVASHCGYTPQYTPLEAIYEKYQAQGFAVLGFPCNQFGMQEPGDAGEISSFCTQMYGVTFPMFSKIEVNGAGSDPIYNWLKAQPGGAGDITWNFNKFLIGRDGKLIARYDSPIVPDSAQVTTAIEAALAK